MKGFEDTSKSISRSETAFSSNSSENNLLSADLLAQYDNVIKSFCPNILISALNKSEEIYANSASIKGTCMLADISGFTKLSEHLGRDGVNGIDTLRRATTRFLSQFVYLVYSYGGDVISFAGDALICIFPAKPHHPPCECKRMAIECGMKLKEHCTEKLTAHIAVSYGDICFALLGGHLNDWVYAINGSCIQQLSDCIDEAKSKELVITPECFDIQRNCYLDGVQYENTPLGNKRIIEVAASSLQEMDSSQCFTNRFDVQFSDNTALTLNILSFIPTPVVSSLTAGSFKTVSELREVTTVFVKLDSYDPVLNQDLMTLQQFVVSAQEVLALAGGVLRQFLVDDKGCVLIALWGVPSASYPNNAHRALAFSQSLSKVVERMGHECSIGVTTGNAYCGTIGSILRRDYVAMGDCVNMSARLMGKAKGRILVDDTTYMALPESSRENLIRAESMMLKGRSVPMEPFELPVGKSRDLGKANSLRSSRQFGLGGSMSGIFEGISMDSHARGEVAMCPILLRKLKKLDSYNDEELEENKQLLWGEETTGRNSNLLSHVEETLNDLISHLRSLVFNAVRPRQDRFQKYFMQTKSGENAGFPLMKYLVVEGPSGSGKSTVARYFRDLSFRNKIRSFFVTAAPDDMLEGYGVYRRLFRALVGANAWDTMADQKRTVVSLLQMTYPDLTDDCILRNKFPVLQEALQLTWHLKLQSNGKFSAVQGEEFSILTKMRGGQKCWITMHKNASTPGDVLHTMLKDICTTIIIDNIHYCDTMSWRELSLLTTHHLPLVLLLTASPNLMPNNELAHAVPSSPLHAPVEETCGMKGLMGGKKEEFAVVSMGKYGNFTPKPKSKSSKSARKVLPVIATEKPSLTSQSSQLAPRIVPHLITTNPNGDILHLEPLTSEQVYNLIVALLGDKVQKDLVKLVQDISSGNAFWVVLIVSYIHQFGLNSFMESVRVSDTCRITPGGTLEDNDVVLEENVCVVHPSPKAKSYSISHAHRKYGGVYSNESTSNNYPIEFDSRLLRNYIVSLIDKLSSAEQLVLRHAAVIGVRFSAAVLCDIIESGMLLRNKDGSIDDALAKLQKESFIIRTSPHEQFYMFQNHRIREIVYDFTPPSDAYRIHRRVAQSFEKRYRGSPSESLVYEALTYHFHMTTLDSGAEEPRRKAVGYAISSANMFIELGNFGSALEYLEYAISMANDNVEEYSKIWHAVSRTLSFMSPGDSFEHTEGMSRSRSGTADGEPNTVRSAQDDVSKLFYENSSRGGDEALDKFKREEYEVLLSRTEKKLRELGVEGELTAVAEQIERKEAGEKGLQENFISMCVIS